MNSSRVSLLACRARGNALPELLLQHAVEALQILPMVRPVHEHFSISKDEITASYTVITFSSSVCS